MITKKENIAEYVLSIWQMEDLIRAFHNDEALAQQPFLQELQQMMLQEGKMEKGHLQITEVAISEMDELHAELYEDNALYKAAWLQVMPAITVFKAKTDTPAMSDMTACLYFLYDILLLRLQKKTISKETEAVQQQVAGLLRELAITYRDL